jgi:hypothetical protein
MTFEQKLKSKIKREANKDFNVYLDYENGANLLAPLLIEAYQTLQNITEFNTRVEHSRFDSRSFQDMALETLNRLEQFTEE